MKLFERLRHSEKSTLAIAIAAIPANREIDKYVVATAIPAIRAIPRMKPVDKPFQNSQIARISIAKPKNENSASVLAALSKFQFNNFDNDPDQELISRINNMAWEFMQVDGMDFETAIGTAAEIVVHCAVANCEASYADVRMLWDKMKCVPTELTREKP